MTRVTKKDLERALDHEQHQRLLAENRCRALEKDLEALHREISEYEGPKKLSRVCLTLMEHQRTIGRRVEQQLQEFEEASHGIRALQKLTRSVEEQLDKVTQAARRI